MAFPPPEAEASSSKTFQSSPAARRISPSPIRRVQDDLQPTPADLEAMGIKVRDWAYNNPLVPLKSIKHPSRRNPRALKRLRPDGTEVLDHGYGFIMGVARTRPPDSHPVTGERPNKLRRTDTSLSIPSHSSLFSMLRGNSITAGEEADLRAACDVFSQPLSQEQWPQSQGTPPPQSQEHSQGHPSSQHQPPHTPNNPSDYESYVPTPPITPNGTMLSLTDPPGSDELPTVTQEGNTPPLEEPPRTNTPLHNPNAVASLTRTLSRLSSLSSLTPMTSPPSSPVPSSTPRYALRSHGAAVVSPRA
ncbi:unnamed protein product [Mycena citricolor]|uniref:Uncharacterized protein n=1 Tax=Mycena citricolor TaxID=2018698 RepID=A0AAD2Q4J3_9AGAR|nr:unnamed protein product [Mycena citricolor]CAK5275471.1 unnamed protein product [Mycena citricolor]